VRGWSTKIQHQGVRKTFALSAPTRAAAEAEARALIADIASEGWEVVVGRHQRENDRVYPKTDPRHWRQRLVLRRNSFPDADDHTRPFSASIQHQGRGCYFPLGTAAPEAAAAKALAIYRMVIEKGWEFVWARHPREVTLAFHWRQDPLLWTYTTMHTLVDGPAGESRRLPMRPREKRRVLVVEPDGGLRRALQLSVAADGQYEPAACASLAEAPALAAAGAALCIANRDLADSAPNLSPDRALAEGAGLKVIWYSVHSDSETLFAATPGGRSGYLLKRVLPTALFEPIASRWDEASASATAFANCVQAWFLRVLQQPPTRAESDGASLTGREQDVLNLLSKGCVDKEIAAALGISVWTVHEHLKRIFEKLQVHSRTEAVLAHLQK
jgi:DNA-binding NarL/FixJ family response regulator